MKKIKNDRSRYLSRASLVSLPNPKNTSENNVDLDATKDIVGNSYLDDFWYFNFPSNSTKQSGKTSLKST